MPQPSVAGGRSCGPSPSRRLSRPIVEPQSEAADCGFVCVSAILAMYGHRVSVSAIKAVAGSTARGLTLRQLRDVMRAVGVGAEAIKFDPTRPEAYPAPGVILLQYGHYVVVRRRRGSRLEIYDPAFGWGMADVAELAAKANGLGVFAAGVEPALAAKLEARRAWPGKGILSLAARRDLAPIGGATLLLTALAQMATLSLPLLSKQAIDASSLAAAGGPFVAVAIGFFLASLTSAVTSFAGNSLGQRLSQSLSRSAATVAYDHLAAKPSDWFDSHKASAIQNKLSSLDAQIAWRTDLLRAVGSTLVIFAVGLVAVFAVSPILVLPGLVSFLLTCAIEFCFTRIQAPATANFIEALQARQAFALDMLGQLPLLRRSGVIGQAKAAYSALIDRVATTDARTQSLRNRQALVIAFVRSAETLLFVGLASAFMLRGQYSLGSFVALAAYKDLLTQSLKTLFQFQQRHELLEAHRLQAEDLTGPDAPLPPEPRTITHGAVAVSNVWFRYGSLDAPVLRGVSMEVRPGECVVIKGPSGGGKSTLAKLICGLATAESGGVLIDGDTPERPMAGFSAVLQTDRLVSASIRENVRLFREDVSDEDIIEALRLAQLDDFVLSLPMRLNTAIAEGMAGLSGGQRQRLLLARALATRPKLLLLDEATSSLDIETEARIIAAVRDIGATVILIAHRPEVWTRADREITIADGEIREDPAAGCVKKALQVARP
ncbi:MAG: hypothetical protein JWP35_2741 [Caulobacter sp.]|nr:hypothetical protein [Caulobacter sp.]